MCSADIFLAILAILFPPLPVWVKCGICSVDSIINILLSILGFIPGLLHSWYIIAKYPEPPYEYESLPQHNEGGRVTYVYVQCPGGHQHQPKQQARPNPGGNSMNYGTHNASNSRQNQPAPQQQGVTNANANANANSSANAGEGSSDNQGVPPSYADVVAGDHKVQSQD